MSYYVISANQNQNELYHHGIMGMKWGVRRYQNEDGTLTEKGKKRYAKVSESEKLQTKQTKNARKMLKLIVRTSANPVLRDMASRKIGDIDSGRIKAGRDFIVQKDYNTWPLLSAVPVGGLFAAPVAASISNASRDRKYTTDKRIHTETIAIAPTIVGFPTTRTLTLVERKGG